MRVCFGLIVLASCLSCSDSTTQVTSINDPTAATPEQIEFEDYSGHVTSDGARGVFLSNRSGGISLAYSFDQTQPEKVKRLTSTEGVEEKSVVMTPDASWILIWQKSDSKSTLTLRDWAGTNSRNFDLEPDDQVLSTSIVSDPSTLNGYIGFSIRNKEGTTAKVVPVSLSNGTVLFGNAESWNNEDKLLFSASKKMYSVQEGTASKKIIARSWNGASWVNESSTLELNAFGVSRGALGDLGFLYPQTPKEKLIRNKSGNRDFSGSNESSKVGVVDDLVFFDATGATQIDFSKEQFRAKQPLSIASVSASTTGNYLLLMGSDTYFCEDAKTLPVVVMTLVRVSDLATIPFIVSKKTTDSNWSQLVTNPCSLFKMQETYEFDNTVVRASVYEINNGKLSILFESKATGDREIRFASFSVDWNALEISDTTFSEVSENKRK